MSSNSPWGNNFEGTYSTTVGQADNSGSWNRPVVNTPQTNPASWPQLGADQTEKHSTEPPEQELPRTSVMNNNAASNSESDPGGTSAWGRSSGGSGWGTPSTGPAWGQRSTSNVDDGTAVWGKSGQTQQPQGNWGGPTHASQETEQKPPTGWGAPTHKSQDNEPKPSSGWGGPAHGSQDNEHKPPSGWGATASGSQDNEQKPPSGWGGTEQNSPMNNQEGNSTASSQQSIPVSQASSGNQPVSWAKAAAAGLPPTSTGTEAPSSESEQVVTEAPVQQPPAPEADPVQKLVNSHEGWGKKPIQQGTSWNINESSSAVGRPSNTVNNGTEAWGKVSGGQMPPGPGWGDPSANKQPSGWGANQQSAQPGERWGVPTQQQQPRPSFNPGNSGGAMGWGNPPQQGMSNGKWNDATGQTSNNPSGWGAPPAPQNPGWGAMPSSNENNSTGWGNAQAGRPGPQGAGWGNNMMPQSSVTDQSTWGRSADGRRQSTVDDGTSAWGDPGTYSKVNMWDKSKAAGGNPETAGGQMPNTNSQIEPKGWGAPPNQPPNKPPSPKGWGDVSPTQTNPVDTGTSGWGQKPVAGDKWDKGNGTGNWNASKQSSGGGWGQPNDQQWGSSDNGSNWGQNSGKVSVSFQNFFVCIVYCNCQKVVEYSQLCLTFLVLLQAFSFFALFFFMEC